MTSCVSKARVAMTGGRPTRAGMPCRRWLAGLLLASGCALAMAQPAQPVEPLRPEVAKALHAAQEAIRAGQGAEALARVKEAQAVADLNPQERYLTERMLAPAAALSGDAAAAVRAFEAALASGRTPPAERPALWQAMVQSAQRAGDAAATVRAGRGYLADGGRDARVRLGLAQALLTLNEPAAALPLLQALRGEDEAAGRVPAEPLLRRLVVAQRLAGSPADHRQALELLLRHHPTPAAWSEWLGPLPARTDWPESLQIDVWRLARQAGALGSVDACRPLIRALVQAGQPGEALAVLEQALRQAGAGAPDEAELQRSLRRAAEEDRAQWPAAEASARRAPDGGPLVALGLAQVSQGQTQAGLALIEAGVTRGVRRQPEQARLRWAGALWQAGRADEARALWTALQSSGEPAVAELARAWLWLR